MVYAVAGVSVLCGEGLLETSGVLRTTVPGRFLSYDSVSVGV